MFFSFLPWLRLIRLKLGISVLFFFFAKGLEIEISQIEGKFKVSQNQIEENRKGVEDYFNRNENLEMAEFISKKGAFK